MKQPRIFLMFLIFLLFGCADEPRVALQRLQGEHYLLRGRELVTGLAACGSCHGAQPNPQAPLSGGLEWEDRYGQVFASNLTPHETGLGGAGVGDIVRALRFFQGKQERPLSRELHAGYEWLSTEDAFSIAAYLQSLPPVSNEVPKRELGFVERYTTGILEKEREVTGYVPDIPKNDPVSYGRYLVDHVARCGFCHHSEAGMMTSFRYLGGGRLRETPWGAKVAPNIGSSEVYGIGSWSEEDILRYLNTGLTPDQRRIDSRFCPTEFYSRADQSDKEAIAKYLRSLPE